jgi:hypothetical protein
MPLIDSRALRDESQAEAILSNRVIALFAAEQQEKILFF